MMQPPREGLMPGASGAEELIFEGNQAVLPGFGALLLTVLTVGIWGLVCWIRTRSVRYKITSQRVIIERGLFSKHLEQIDLYRVVDYVVDRPFGQRIMGTGNIVLESADKTTPEVRIDNVKTDVVALYERLRYCTEQEKKKRGVRVVDLEK